MEQKPHSQEDREDEKAEGYVPDEGTRYNPRKTSKGNGDRQSSRKRIQINDMKMIQDLGKRMEAKIEKMQEMFNTDLEELKNKQTEMNNTITEMKNTLEGINSRITEAEERISDLEDTMVEFTTAEQNKEKRMKRNEGSLRDLWDNIKRNNIHITGVPEEERKDSRKYLKRL